MKFLHEIPETFLEPEEKSLIVSARTKKLWAVLLDMLLSFDEVCRRNKIKYFMDAGTFLGAVRHNGFIPWDDDIDVIMLRDDYDKLCSIAADEFKYPLFFQTNQTDPGSARGHAQLRRTDTTEILKSELNNSVPLYEFNQGVFLDIFILDSVPDNAAELSSFRRLILEDKKRVAALKRLLYKRDWRRMSIRHPRTIISAVMSVWYRFVRKAFGRDKLVEAYRKLETDVSMYNGKGMHRVANFSFDPLKKDGEIFDRKLFDSVSYYEFEGYKIPGPTDYESFLRGSFGDWHEHVIGGTEHGGVLLDLDKPYTEYLKK